MKGKKAMLEKRISMYEMTFNGISYASFAACLITLLSVATLSIPLELVETIFYLWIGYGVVALSVMWMLKTKKTQLRKHLSQIVIQEKGDIYEQRLETLHSALKKMTE